MTRRIDFLIATKIMNLEVFQATDTGYTEDIDLSEKGDIFYFQDNRWQGPGWVSVYE